MIKLSKVLKFKELKDKRKNNGKHFLFEVEGKDGCIIYYVNRIPYNGEIENNPNDFYAIVRNFCGEPCKNVGFYSPSQNKINEVTDCPEKINQKPTQDEKKVNPLTANLSSEIPDKLKNNTQPSLPGLIVNKPKNNILDHWIVN